jgi:hypothetical protein
MMPEVIKDLLKSRFLSIAVFFYTICVWLLAYSSVSGKFANPNTNIKKVTSCDSIFNKKLMQKKGVDYSMVHILIAFKENSFCQDIDIEKQLLEVKKGERKQVILPLCSAQFDSLFFPTFNTSGMKHPTYRKTTSKGTIGEEITRLESIGEITLQPWQYYLRDDPHAWYDNYCDQAEDLRLYQMHKDSIDKASMGYFQYAWSRPNSCESYIDFLERHKYNPSKAYYIHLRDLMSQYRRGLFASKYQPHWQKWGRISL